MFSKRSDEALFLRIRKMRAKIRKETEEELALKEREARAAGKFLWENNWVTPDESRKIQRKLKVRDKIVLAELAILTAFIGFSSLAIYVVLIRVLLPR